MHLIRRRQPTRRLHIRQCESRIRPAHLPQSRGHPIGHLLLDFVEVVVDPVRPQSSQTPVRDALGCGGADEFGSGRVGVGGRAPEEVVELDADGFDGFGGAGPGTFNRGVGEVAKDVGRLVIGHVSVPFMPFSPAKNGLVCTMEDTHVPDDNTSLLSLLLHGPAQPAECGPLGFGDLALPAVRLAIIDGHEARLSDAASNFCGVSEEIVGVSVAVVGWEEEAGSGIYSR